MKNKKGFTLIEVLVTITILALITIIIVPTTISISKSVRQKALDTKINEAEEATILWAQDNKSCLVSDDENCMIDQNDCSNFNENGIVNDEIKVCKVTIGELAENNLIKNDGKDGSGKIIILNPVDKDNDISDTEITFTYNTETKLFNIYSMNFVYNTTTKKSGASKTTTIKSLLLSSNSDKYNAQTLNVKMTLTDPYGGNVKVCITNVNNINSCASWEDVAVVKRKNKDYTKTIDLASFNSENTTGSGKNVTVYVFVKNDATNENSELYGTDNANYKIYKYCDSLDTYEEGSWSACPVSCGGGTQSKTSKRRDKFFTSIECDDLTETKSCNTMACCSETTTSATSWTSCSASCDGGTQTRTVTYKSKYDGRICKTEKETQSCNTIACCSDATSTTTYTDWTTCSASCGGGTQTRTKTVTSNINNSVCESKTETQSCNTMDCCSDTTTAYGDWGSCSASCGGGTQTRTGTKTSIYDGRLCETITESQSCNTQKCCTNVTKWTCNSPTVSVGSTPYIGDYSSNCFAVKPCYCTWNGLYYDVYSGYVNLYTECV